MSPSTKPLEELQKLSERLDREADELASVFENLEQQLRFAKVSVSAWVDAPLIEMYTDYDDPDSTDTGWTIGYCQLDSNGESTWQLAARKEKRFFTGRGNQKEYDDEEVVVDGPIPLSQAPRLVRVEAVGLLDGLVDLLTSKTRRFLESIAAARKTASAS